MAQPSSSTTLPHPKAPTPFLSGFLNMARQMVGAVTGAGSTTLGKVNRSVEPLVNDIQALGQIAQVAGGIASMFGANKLAGTLVSAGGKVVEKTGEVLETSKTAQGQLRAAATAANNPNARKLWSNTATQGVTGQKKDAKAKAEERKKKKRKKKVRRPGSSGPRSVRAKVRANTPYTPTSSSHRRR